MKNRALRIYLITAWALTAAASVAGIWLLPQTLVMQLAASGEAGTTMPKAMALLTGPALCVLSWALWRADGRKNDAGAAVAAAAALLSQAFMYAVNL